MKFLDKSIGVGKSKFLVCELQIPISVKTIQVMDALLKGYRFLVNSSVCVHA